MGHGRRVSLPVTHGALSPARRLLPLWMYAIILQILAGCGRPLEETRKPCQLP